MHAPLFHPAMKTVAPIRKMLGIKTFFNMLGPLVNPAFPKKQLTGVFNLELARLYAYISQADEGKRFAVLHSLDGYDEISLTGSFKLIDNEGDKLLEPADLGMETLRQNELYGGKTVEDAAGLFRGILGKQGHRSAKQCRNGQCSRRAELLFPEKRHKNLPPRGFRIPEKRPGVAFFQKIFGGFGGLKFLFRKKKSRSSCVLR